MRVMKYISVLLFVFLLSACNNDPTVYDTKLHPGIDTINLDGTWIDAGAYIEVGEATINMTTTDTVDTSVMGLYEIEYTATYDALSYSIIRYVIVTDTESPVGTLNPGLDTVQVNDTWIDAFVTATDNVDIDLDITITNPVDETTPGTYHVEYKIEDDYGNVTYLIRVVTVIE